jgi:hypothetical protein
LRVTVRVRSARLARESGPLPSHRAGREGQGDKK